MKPIAAITNGVFACAATELPQHPDRDLIERFAEGDREAFTTLYRTHHPAVFRTALHMTGDRGKAAELTQDVFVWLMQHARDFDPARGALAAFLGGVARQLVRRRERDERRWLPFGEERQAAAETDPSRAVDAGTLRKAIASLPMRYREAVVLCDLEGKSYEEAAAELGCAVGTIRSRLHRAREVLARKFQPKRSPK